MRDIYVVGVGEVAVSKRGSRSITQLGGEAIRCALDDCGLEQPRALFVGNMLSGLLSNQKQLGAVLAEALGWRDVEALSVDAACGSGGAAMRLACLTVASGAHESVIACGVEQMTHVDKAETTRALATASDWSSEGRRGQTFLSLNATLTKAYLERYGLDRDVLAPFAINAHANASRNPNAVFQKTIDIETYRNSREVSDPLRLFDVSPICDGAAAAVIVNRDLALAVARSGRPVTEIRASALATDSLSVRERAEQLTLRAAKCSTLQAYRQAGMTPNDIDVFELHDAYTIMSVLSLEAAGFADPGLGHTLGAEGEIGLTGRIPITTMGGLKGRGHPVGASGIYQVVEAHRQLVGGAGDNQVPNAAIAMTQSIGGTGATISTHILERRW